MRVAFPLPKSRLSALVLGLVLGVGCDICSSPSLSGLGLMAAVGYQASRDAYLGADIKRWGRSGFIDPGQGRSETVISLTVRHFPHANDSFYWSASAGLSRFNWGGLVLDSPAIGGSVGWPFRTREKSTLVAFMDLTQALAARDGIRPSLLSLGLAIRWY